MRENFILQSISLHLLGTLGFDGEGHLLARCIAEVGFQKLESNEEPSVPRGGRTGNR